MRMVHSKEACHLQLLVNLVSHAKTFLEVFATQSFRFDSIYT